MRNISEKEKVKEYAEPVFSYVPGISPLHKLDPRTKIIASDVTWDSGFQD